MIHIEKLQTGEDSGVAASVREFAELHSLVVEVVPAVTTASALLVLRPPRLKSERLDRLAAAAAEHGVSVYSTPGLDPEAVVDWLDGLEGPTITLYVAGPTEEESPRMAGRASRLLHSVLEAE